MKITSVILGIISIVLMLASALIAYASFYSIIISKGENASAMSATVILAIVLIVIAILSASCGSLFGIIALFKKNESKLFVIIGICLNLFTLLTCLCTVIYGFLWFADNVKGRPFG